MLTRFCKLVILFLGILVMLLVGISVKLCLQISCWNNSPKACQSPGNPPCALAPKNITLTTRTDISDEKLGELMELQDEQLEFRDSHGITWVAPKGTLTDGASVPQYLLSITDDRYTKTFLRAAVLHDAYCGEANSDENKNRYHTRLSPENPYHTKSKDEVNEMFYYAMIAGGTNAILALEMYAGVDLYLKPWDVPPAEQDLLPDDVLAIGFTGAKNWIKENHLGRDDLGKLVTHMQKRKPLLRTLHEQTTRIKVALEQNNLNRADTLLRKQDELLRNKLAQPQSSTDTMLLNYKGELHKSRAEYYRKANIPGINQESMVRGELSESEKAFETILKRDPKDPNALRGLGRVSLLRNDSGRAEIYLRRALDIAPRFQAVREDLNQLTGAH